MVCTLSPYLNALWCNGVSPWSLVLKRSTRSRIVRGQADGKRLISLLRSRQDGCGMNYHRGIISRFYKTFSLSGFRRDINRNAFGKSAWRLLLLSLDSSYATISGSNLARCSALSRGGRLAIAQLIPYN